LQTEAGYVRVERYVPSEDAWRLVTEHESGERYRVQQAAALRERIYLTECDAKGNKKIQRYQPADNTWMQLRYESLGCQR
jgi:hypothetical protein